MQRNLREGSRNGRCNNVMPSQPRSPWTPCRRPRWPRARSLSVLRIVLVVALPWLSGCAEEEVQFTEIKRPGERITAAEWGAFERIVKALPEPKLAPLADVAMPLPQWQDARTLPVQELVFEERRALADAWDPERVARRFARSRSLPRLLRRERLTVEQFTSLALAIGAAMRRSKLPEDYPWEDLLQRGRGAIDALQRDQRLFSGLPVDVRHRLLDEAVWLHRVDRAQRLREVPAENVALVNKHADWLAEVMPQFFQSHPLDDVTDMLEEYGLPFSELAETGRDDELRWNPAQAVIGRAAP